MIWYFRWPLMIVLGVTFWLALDVGYLLPKDSWSRTAVGVLAFILASAMGAIRPPEPRS